MHDLKVTEHDDGELRCRDLDLAEKLGYAYTSSFRKLIKSPKNTKVLNALGVLATAAETHTAKGGRPGKAFHLNRKQAIYITTQCGTPKARALIS